MRVVYAIKREQKEREGERETDRDRAPRELRELRVSDRLCCECIDRDTQTHRQTDRQTDRQTETEAVAQKHRRQSAHRDIKSR